MLKERKTELGWVALVVVRCVFWLFLFLRTCPIRVGKHNRHTMHSEGK